LSYVWGLRGSRPPAVRDNRHDSAHLFGAVCPERAVGAAVVMPWVSSEAMTIHLAEISKRVSPDAHGVVICDGAGWHQIGKRLAVPDNVSLLPLPPYAPELNPMENVWEYLRGNQPSMTVWDGYTAIVDTCCAAWNSFVRDVKRVVSITSPSWASVKIYGGWYYSPDLNHRESLRKTQGTAAETCRTHHHPALAFTRGYVALNRNPL
jgi:hypothetical protein